MAKPNTNLTHKDVLYVLNQIKHAYQLIFLHHAIDGGGSQETDEAKAALAEAHCRLAGVGGQTHATVKKHRLDEPS